MGDDLNTLLNVPKSVVIQSRTIDLSPIRFGELPKTLELAGPLLAELGNASQPWTALVQRHATRLVPLVALLSRQPEEWVAALGLDDAAELLGYLVAVNSDFFVRRVSPRLVSLMAAMTGASPQIPNPPPAQPSAPGPNSSAS